MRTKDFMQPRFSIRKLTIGAVGVMFGAVIFGVSATQVKAAEQPEQPQTEQVQTEQKQSEQAQPTQTDAAKAVTATAADQDTAAKTETVAKRVVAPGPDQSKVTEKNAEAKVPGLPDGVKANLSVSAKDKDGKTEEVNNVSKDDENKIDNNKVVAVDLKNAQDVEAHLTIKNDSNQDKTIGETDAYHTRDLRLKFDYGDSMLIDQNKPASITITDNNGKQVEGNSDLEVWYMYTKNGSSTWEKFEDWTKQDGANKNTKMIGVRGTLKAGYTAKVNVPLVKNETSQKTSTDISLFDLFSPHATLNVETKASKDPLWNVNDLKGAEVILATRQGDDYVEISKEDSDAIKQDNFPDASAVVKVTDSGDVFDQSGQNFYKDGYYNINLKDIQKVLQKHGYTVNPDATKDSSVVMDHYTYNSFSNSTALNIIRNGQAQEGAKSGKPVFYIEVHKVLDTKDTEFEEGSTEAKNFNPSDLVNSVSNVTEDPQKAKFGTKFNDTPVDKGQAKTDITDSQGNHVDKIDENTKPGTYYVTVSYKLNGKDDKSMLITKTATVKVTAKADTTPSDQDNKGGKTDNNKGSDTTPTTPVTPETPEVPDTPDTPDSPAIDNNDTADVETPDVPDAPEAPSTKDDTVTKTLPAATAIAKKLAPAAVSVKKAGAVKAAAPSQKAALPQTGSENATGIIGILAAILGLFGLGFSKRRN